MNAKQSIVLAVALTMVVSALSFAPAASARVWVRSGIQVYAPPPPLRHEVVIARPGPRHVWVPGYWSWAARPPALRLGRGQMAPPPYPRAVWVGPRVAYRHHHRYYYGGYWRH